MRFFLSPLLILSAWLTAEDGVPTVRIVQAYPQCTFSKPLALVWPASGGDIALVVEQAGTIRSLTGGDDATKAPIVLDLRDQVLTKGREEGLLALALHPDFPRTKRIFIWASIPEPRRNQLIEYAWAGNQADPATAKVLLSLDDPYANHNGGTVIFGRDGFLYVSTGDGGSGGDPKGNGQNLDTLFGKILRLDVDRADADRPYAIPADNPFVGQAGARPEIWAYGLRNVWRMNFDRETGDLWAGDVGQNKYEEIDVIVKGGNYGWNVREGMHDFKAGGQGPFIEPVVEYGRQLGISVTGGHVYRGTRIPSLVGWYVYGDFQTGHIWALKRDADQVRNVEIAFPRHSISSFAEDPQGELLYTAFDGRIYRLMP